ncbi:MAG: tRNA lysidine(34) synthetase TilS [Planctomycetes bacterium]|nr:tRNA lysidine(34) synthetase TilS [Planctomycetota bacterium]
MDPGFEPSKRGAKNRVMRLPIKVASTIRARKLIEPDSRVMVGLSGGPDSVALLRCLLELSEKRDLKFELCAAHLNHRLRGKTAERDQAFCRKLCKARKIDFLEARCDTKKLALQLKRSHEETARILRRTFLAHASRIKACNVVALAHHADDRIETVLYRLCRGTGLAGLEGIGWTGPLPMADGPDVSEWIEWLQHGKPCGTPFAPPRSPMAERIVRPMLGMTREEIITYLKSKKQRFCTDETNFDTRIPRNALRQLVLPVLEKKVHPGVRSALWRLAEEAEFHAERRAWRRGWLDGIAAVGSRGFLTLPVPKVGSPPSTEELADVVSLLKTLWRAEGLAVGAKHLAAIRDLFGPSGKMRVIHLPGQVVAERKGREVILHRAK